MVQVCILEEFISELDGKLDSLSVTETHVAKSVLNKV